jgi:hypothetical protein
MVQERRTRISEKLRKLQDLVPNMDKVITTLLSRCHFFAITPVSPQP